MCSFGISFSDDFSGMQKAPRGFCPARLKIGLLSERIFSDRSVWSVEQYLRHWRETARRCVEDKQSVIFCSSLSKRNADLWVGIYEGETVKFYSFMTQLSDVIIDGIAIYPKSSFSAFVGEPSSEWSCWEVPSAYLKCLADGAEV